MRRILAMLFVPSLISAQVISERVDLGVYQRIRDEGLTHSRIDSLAHHLTDVIGPRLTGSPGMRRANEWTAQQFRQWGLSNVQVEPWGEFGRGWERVSYSGRVTSPYVKELRAIPSGWTGSTKGTITARVAVVKGGLAELSRSPGAFAGQVVMLNAPAYGGAQSAHTPTRVPLDTLLDPTVRPPQPRIGWDTLLVQIRASQATRDAAVKASGAVAVLTASGTLYGMIRGGGDWAAIDPKAPEPLPELVLPQEEYNQLYRDAERQTPVTLELNVQNRFVTDDTKGYNTLADLRGATRPGST
jgi:carboxypeptidase Q